MGDRYLGEIRMFGGNFAPAGWAFCDGALLPISENDALFALIGTTYGGDGQMTFAVPDLRGRLPLHQGTGGGQTFVMGQSGGTEMETLTLQQIPAHSHVPVASSAEASSTNPAGHVWAATASNAYATAGSPSAMAPNLSDGVGGGQPHENRMPYLAVSFIISLYGIFPTQT
ncbi:tail fiber protein [Alcanivorax sp. JB21]|uniref:phage tail protein n=1 Tax=Alcanivorax limicola TaxID=2874102 RepID=UPI001CBC0046|nr:tail fiber protein [Alcanivorax limicola]MBZ2187477.1 tail fiber protein [Alcanivorax limicola]